MMRLTVSKSFGQVLWLLLLGLAFAADVAAHGELDWNDFKIDNKNNSVETSIQHAKQVISDIVLARREVSKWPDPELLRVQNDLSSLKEEVDDMLNHFREDGIHMQLTSALRANPRAGRAVAGSYAIEIGIELIEHMTSLDSPAAFADELHTGGIGAYMFDLMDAYADNMGLYAALIEKTD
jgi:hypothetical protein